MPRKILRFSKTERGSYDDEGELTEKTVEKTCGCRGGKVHDFAVTNRFEASVSDAEPALRFFLFVGLFKNYQNVAAHKVFNVYAADPVRLSAAVTSAAVKILRYKRFVLEGHGNVIAGNGEVFVRKSFSRGERKVFTYLGVGVCDKLRIGLSRDCRSGYRGFLLGGKRSGNVDRRVIVKLYAAYLSVAAGYLTVWRGGRDRKGEA